MWSCTFHQNVAKLVGYCMEPSFMIATKLYELDLFTFIHHPDEPLPAILALKLGGDIANAMNYMQEIGIVHRDLKSANVLLETVAVNEKESMLKGMVSLVFRLACSVRCVCVDLSSCLFFIFIFHFSSSFFVFVAAVICDFGLARVTNAATTLENMKFKDIGGFSPRYAAPEVFATSLLQISPDSETDKKSDVYSFAIVLWEMVTRKVPWDGMTKDQIEASVRNGLRVRALDFFFFSFFLFFSFLFFSFLFFSFLSHFSFSPLTPPLSPFPAPCSSG